MATIPDPAGGPDGGAQGQPATSAHLHHPMPYPPSWVDDSGSSALPLWAVYDQFEGFTPPWALVSAATASEAEDAAMEISKERLGPRGPEGHEYENLVVIRLVRDTGL